MLRPIPRVSAPLHCSVAQFCCYLERNQIENLENILDDQDLLTSTSILELHMVNGEYKSSQIPQGLGKSTIF